MQVNLGNVHFLPLAVNPYGYSPERMRAVLDAGLADIAATGANCIRLWLHIDGRLSPTWGEPEVRRWWGAAAAGCGGQLPGCAAARCRG
jgi:hypothetical protein